MKNCPRKYQAFTLIEMVAVIIILGIIAVVGTTFLQSGFNAFFTRQDVSEANWQGRFALEQMARRIRIVRSPTDISTANASQFTFVDLNGNTDSYTLSGSTLELNGIPLADGVSSLTFAYLDRNTAVTAVLTNIRYVIVTLGITLNNVNYTLRTTIMPRNLP